LKIETNKALGPTFGLFVILPSFSILFMFHQGSGRLTAL
jgi:hypothetical protein